MGSEDDAKDNESDQSGSGFGPPVDDFGPPVSEFGPPVGEFGPPVGEFGPSTRGKAPQWQVPEPATDHPELIWRPADEPPTTPPPPAQYRAPDTTVFPDGPPPAAPPARQPQPPADSDEDLTVRHATPPAGVDRDTWWNRPTDSGGVPTSPPEPSRRSDSVGLSWSDDPIAKRLAPSPAIPTPVFTPNRKHRSRGRWIVLGAVVAIAVVVALAVTIVAVKRDSGGGGGVAAPPATTTAALSCPTSREGKVTVGNGAGDTASAPGAILGFQYSFYVERSGERARRFVDPEALNVSTADIIQQAINDQIPVGTTHCLRITELATDTFDVDLTEHHTDGVTTVYRQTVTTTNRDGKTLIYAIRERA